MTISKKRDTRKKRMKDKIIGSSKRPRISVFRSSKHIYAQLIDDSKRITLVGLSEKSIKSKLEKKTKIEIAELLGEELAKQAKSKKILKVVFDRSGYKYHGRIKALAEGARKGGLKF